MPIDEPVKKGGFVYFMTNQAMPGHVKIGSTRLHPDERARQLSSGTAVARPFKVIEFEWFEDGVLLHAERELHAKYRQYRVPNREFFEIGVTPEMARAAILEVRNLLAAGKPLDRALPSAPTTTNNVSPPSAGGDTNASVLGLPYWTEFNKMRDARKLLPPFENPGRGRFFHRYFLVKPSQKTGFRNIHYEGRIRISDPQVSMRLIFKRAADIKEMFDLIAQDRDTIEKEVGFRLQWLRDRGLKESHIAVERDDMDPRDATNWQRQHEWLSDLVSAFEKFIAPRVAKLPPIAR